ncbi:MAG: thioredoxin fold domain-containing protein [Candidatus Eisenbacteria bacterium]|nr:thioredoxin fold domain-containing protein [Candidatus Eisenbacteria bacterium]
MTGATAAKRGRFGRSVLALVLILTCFVAACDRSGEDAGVRSDGDAGRTRGDTTAPSSGDAVANRDLPKLIDLGADKCTPCKMMAPILEELRTTYEGDFEVVFIDVWKEPEAAREYGVNVIPTQLFLDESGDELFRHQGFYSREEILAKWRELGYEFEPSSPTS